VVISTCTPRISAFVRVFGNSDRRVDFVPIFDRDRRSPLWVKL
jgi:hypothetical protein